MLRNIYKSILGYGICFKPNNNIYKLNDYVYNIYSRKKIPYPNDNELDNGLKLFNPFKLKKN